MAVLGSTVDPRLGAVNPAAIQALSQAGAATGQMYQNLGQSIKGVVSDAQDRKISNNLYEALGESVFDVSQATGVDRNAVTSMLEAARANGLPALRQLQDTFTGFLKADYTADRQAIEAEKAHERRLEEMDFDSELTEERMDLSDKFLKENNKIANQFKSYLQDDTQAHSLLFQGRGFGQETSERLGKEKFLTSERLGKEKFLDFQRRKGESFTDYQRRATELYEKLQDERRSDLKMEEDDNLYANMLYYQKEFDLAKSQNNVDMQKAILRNKALVEEEIIARKTTKANQLADQLRSAMSIEEGRARDDKIQSIQMEFANNDLAVPDTSKFVFSLEDLNNRVQNGDWTNRITKDIVPKISMRFSYWLLKVNFSQTALIKTKNT